MDTYSTRLLQFFLQSIHTLKKESGGQRWNEICNATAELALVKNPFSISFRKEELWKLFFHPPETIQESTILPVKSYRNILWISPGASIVTCPDAGFGNI